MEVAPPGDEDELRHLVGVEEAEPGEVVAQRAPVPQAPELAHPQADAEAVGTDLLLGLPRQLPHELGRHEPREGVVSLGQGPRHVAARRGAVGGEEGNVGPTGGRSTATLTAAIAASTARLVFITS